MTISNKIIRNILGDKVSRNKVSYHPADSTISTVDGEKKFVKRVNDEQLDMGDYSISRGYWVIHHGDLHDIYR